MARASQTTIQCTQCRQPVRATIQGVVDATQDPQAKAALLSGRLNVAMCQNCGTVNTVMMPLLYHDASKEMLIAFVPMELGLSKDAQEKAIGELMREVTSQLPQGGFKAYLLQPRHALTLQGLIEQVLEGDGITPQMMEAQRARVRLFEQMIQSPDEALDTLIQQHNSEIDAAFFQTMTVLLQQMLAEGRTAVAQRLAQVQNRVVELSTFGQELVAKNQMQEQVVQEVAQAVNELGEEADRADFMRLAISYAGDEDRLQALVGLVRPIFDYQFFQELTTHIGQAPSAEREGLETLRDTLRALAAMVDQQAQAAMAEAAALLQEMLNSPNPDELIEESLPLLDYTFMQVLSLNIQEAQRRSDLNASARLKDIYNRVVGALQGSMPPELRFVNELLSAPDEQTMTQMVNERAREFGPSLVEAIDAVSEQAQGQDSPELAQRLAWVRQQVLNTLGNWLS